MSNNNNNNNNNSDSEEDQGQLGNISGNIVQITSNIGISGNMTVLEGNVDTTFSVPIYGNLTVNQTINGNGYVVVNQQGDGVTHTTFDTTNPEFDPQIDQNLVGQVEAYYEDEQHSH
jgi:hypothetical protein